MTHTYALLEVSPEAYEEIKARIIDAGQPDRIHSSHGETLNMQGIALTPGAKGKIVMRQTEQAPRYPSKREAQEALAKIKKLADK